MAKRFGGISCFPLMLITVRARKMLPMSAQTLEVPLGLIQGAIGLPRWLSGKESAWQCRRLRRCGLDPWDGKIPRRRKWYPTLVLLWGQSHGQRSQVGYSPWGGKELDTTEQLSPRYNHTLRANMHILAVVSS